VVTPEILISSVPFLPLLSFAVAETVIVPFSLGVNKPFSSIDAIFSSDTDQVTVLLLASFGTTVTDNCNGFPSVISFPLIFMFSTKTGGAAIPETCIVFSAETPEPSLASTFTITSPFDTAVNKPDSEICATDVSKTLQVTDFLVALFGNILTLS